MFFPCFDFSKAHSQVILVVSLELWQQEIQKLKRQTSLHTGHHCYARHPNLHDPCTEVLMCLDISIFVLIEDTIPVRYDTTYPLTFQGPAEI